MCFASVMVSISERESVCRSTLSRLSRHGITPVVFTVDDVPLGMENCRINQQTALRYGAEQETDFVLFLEDDLEFCSFFRTALSQAIEQDRDVITFYLAGYSFYPASLKRALRSGGAYLPGVYRITNHRRYFGSQALLLKIEFIEHLLIRWDDGPLDTRLPLFTDDIWAYIPNPVQHYGSRLKSTWSPHGKSHYSRSYQQDE